MVGLGAEAYSSGMIAWYNGLAGAVGILAVCLVLKKMEGMQLYTVAELLETRYGSPLLRFLCAMLSLLALIGILSGQVNSAGSILSSIGIGSPVVGGLIAAAFLSVIPWSEGCGLLPSLILFRLSLPVQVLSPLHFLP